MSLKIQLFDPIEGVKVADILAQKFDSVLNSIMEKKNEFYVHNGQPPYFLLISHEDLKKLLAYYLYVDENSFRSSYIHSDSVWRALDSESKENFLGMSIVVRPGPIEVKGNGRFEFLYGLRGEAKRIDE